MSILITEDLELLGQGTQKLVYAHPDSLDKVIKLMRPENATPDGGRATQNRWRSQRSQGIYRQFRRELLQYLQLCKNSYSAKKFIFPIETVYGFVATDKGLGLVTEKIISPTGSSLTLDHLVAYKMFGKKQKKALDQFFNDCCYHHVVFGEVNVGGIMYTEQRQGYPEFVLVDGIGEKLIIPFRAMSKTINTRNVKKVERKIKEQIGFHNQHRA
ncbi:PhoP regulatory network YrbL family protein [Psychrobacter sp. AH5]|uniref:YrbL family protein n=1 Tax=Psychrobacter sp. AH5 TaxID=2937433 RepID=UPI003341A425